MSLFQITSGFLGICIIVVFISLIGFIQPVDAGTITPGDQESMAYWKTSARTSDFAFTTPLGYPGDQEYKAYLQVVVRDKNNQLASVTESINTWKVPTFFPDGKPAPFWMNTVFYYTLKENYQTVIIDGTKYEKVEYSKTFEKSQADSYLWICANVEVYGEICMKSFYARAPLVWLEEGDVLTEKWTILRNVS